jgi:hypothetical protein
MTINQARDILKYVDEKRKAGWNDEDLAFAMANDFDTVVRKEKQDDV